MGFNPFRGVEDLTGGFTNTFGKASLGMHNSLIQGANMTYGSATAWGTGIGAAYGAVDGGLSYDGSVVGGALHGAMLGAAGGAAARFGAETYAKGAVHNGSASVDAAGTMFKNEWGKGGIAGGNAFKMGNFNTGFFGKDLTP